MAEKEITTTGENERDWRTPPCDILEERDAYRVMLDMPGVDEKNLEVTYQNGSLSIIGKVSETAYGNQYRAARREYPVRHFKREFTLSEAYVNVAQISARLRNGELVVTLPKAETLKPRRIQVQSAS